MMLLGEMLNPEVTSSSPPPTRGRRRSRHRGPSVTRGREDMSPRPPSAPDRSDLSLPARVIPVNRDLMPPYVHPGNRRALIDIQTRRKVVDRIVCSIGVEPTLINEELPIDPKLENAVIIRA